MAYDPFPIGQQPMSSSRGVVIASNQSPVSVAGTLNIAGNPSISGTVLVGNFPTTQNVSGSVVGFQGTSPWIITGSIQGGSTANQSVSGTVGASIIGQLPAGTAVLGSVATLQGTNPWVVSGTIATNAASVITVGQGSIAVAIVSGSIAASFTPPANQSVSGTVQTDVRGSVATVIIGGSIAASFTPPANQSVSGTVQTDVRGSVATVIIGGSIAASFTPPANQSVSGTVQVDVRGSVAVAIISGSVAVATGNSSVMLLNGTNVIGSVATLQGTNPWIVSGNASVTGTMSVLGTVPVTQSTNPWVVGSIVGTYAEDAAHTTADKGIFVLTVRNDTVASTASADLDYTVHAADSAGRTLIKMFAPEESRLDTASSVVSTSVTSLFPSVVGLRNYVTDIMIANTGSVATLVTFKDGSTSILGFTIAPAGGGSNINGMAFPMRTAPSQDFVYQAAVSSSVLYVTAKGYKAP